MHTLCRCAFFLESHAMSAADLFDHQLSNAEERQLAREFLADFPGRMSVDDFCRQISTTDTPGAAEGICNGVFWVDISSNSPPRDSDGHVAARAVSFALCRRGWVSLPNKSKQKSSRSAALRAPGIQPCPPSAPALSMTPTISNLSSALASLPRGSTRPLLYNSFLEIRRLTDKAALPETLLGRAVARGPACVDNIAGQGGLVPETYRLYDLDECQQFFRRVNASLQELATDSSARAAVHHRVAVGADHPRGLPEDPALDPHGPGVNPRARNDHHVITDQVIVATWGDGLRASAAARLQMAAAQAARPTTLRPASRRIDGAASVASRSRCRPTRTSNVLRVEALRPVITTRQPRTAIRQPRKAIRQPRTASPGKTAARVRLTGETIMSGGGGHDPRGDVDWVGGKADNKPGVGGNKLPFTGKGELYHLAQRYVRDPLLLRGCKFHIRAYGMLVSAEPLVAFYRRDAVYFQRTEAEYRREEARDLAGHLTNNGNNTAPWPRGYFLDAAQGPDSSGAFDKSPDREARVGMSGPLPLVSTPSKVLSTLDGLDAELAGEGHTPPGYVATNLEPGIKRAIVFALRALAANIGYKFPGYYHMLAFDFVLDARLNLLLLEVNENAFFIRSHPGVIADTVNLAVDLVEMRREGRWPREEDYPGLSMEIYPGYASSSSAAATTASSSTGAGATASSNTAAAAAAAGTTGGSSTGAGTGGSSSSIAGTTGCSDTAAAGKKRDKSGTAAGADQNKGDGAADQNKGSGGGGTRPARPVVDRLLRLRERYPQAELLVDGEWDVGSVEGCT
eukprot:jgi/Mesvir1/12159/Mv00406-RA.1